MDKLNCKSLIISDNEIKKCNNIIENDIEQSNEFNMFCKNHLYMNRFYNNIIECCICYEKIDKDIEIPLECGHIYHKICLSKLNNNECPLCKKNFSVTEINFFKNHLITINTIDSNINSLNNENNLQRRMLIVQSYPILTIFIIIIFYIIILCLILSSLNII